MVQISEWHCWEIMECDNPQNCLAWKHPERPCWEIIKELNDHRKVFNICQDCIVRILKSENSVLSDIEILTILETKAQCTMDMGTESNVYKSQHCGKKS